MSRPRAAVDSGTNSTRLLVVDADGRDVTRQTRITRLGAGVDASGELSSAALERTLAVIGDYRDRWVEAGVDAADVRIAATSAVRDASNRNRYFDGVHDLTGVRAEVLSGDEEARLSFAGAVGAVDVGDGPVLVVDIGGGSTEVIVGDRDGGVTGAHSMQVGAVRVTERHLAGDPPTSREVAAARAMVQDALDKAADALADVGPTLAGVGTVVGVAGTVTTLAALDAGLDGPDDPGVHGHRITAAAVSAWTDRLLGMTVADRVALPAVPEGRADVIAAGALVLDEILHRTAADAVVVSLADILDGLVARG